jgi:hypothetical protein
MIRSTDHPLIRPLDIIGIITYNIPMSVALKRDIWTPEKRLEQSSALRARKIWLKSTGPRTSEGKAKSCMNARKEGYEDRQQAKRVKNYVRLNRFFLEIHRCQRAQWHTLKAQERRVVLQTLGRLKNELSVLGAKIIHNIENSSNVVPFPLAGSS